MPLIQKGSQDTIIFVDDDEVLVAKQGNYVVVIMLSYIRSIREHHCMLHKLLENYIRFEKVLEVLLTKKMN